LRRAELACTPGANGTASEVLFLSVFVPKGTLPDPFIWPTMITGFRLVNPMSDVFSVAVVDDDEGVCRSLGRLLRVAGFRSVAYDSAEAFLADTKRPRFDCLLLDVQLGGISGVELAERLASSGSSIPVVFITAHDDPIIRMRALSIPGAAYLAKTEPAETMFATIRRAIRSNATWSTPEP